jgi:hypothetical protein
LASAAQLDESELILNPGGSVYHLDLRPNHLVGKVIVAGGSKFSSLPAQSISEPINLAVSKLAETP